MLERLSTTLAQGMRGYVRNISLPSLLPAVAQLAAKVYANEARAVQQMGIDEAISEIVMTTERYWTMARPLKTDPPSLALLVFDPQRANVVMERLELEAFVHALETWSTR